MIQSAIMCPTWWRTCVNPEGTFSLLVIDHGTADRSIGMNSEVYRATFSAHVQPNAPKRAGRSFTPQDEEEDQPSGRFFSRSADLNRQQLFSGGRQNRGQKDPLTKMAAVRSWRSWRSFSRTETRTSEMFEASRLHRLIDHKGFSSKS